MQFIDLKAAYLRQRAAIEQRMQGVLARAQFIMGPEIEELEAELARLVGVAHCVSLGSGTQALEVALRALGIGLGDEVITVAFSWISPAEAIALVGATPVFVDIEARGFGMDPARLEQAITPRSKAILPVSLFGQLPDLARIGELAERHGLTVIEDGAQSFGASQRGAKSCGITRIGCTSFFPSKPLGCYGDGGALFTSDAELAKEARSIRSHGSQDRRLHTRLGMNARLDTLQAAVLLAKLPFFEAELLARERIAERYSARLRERVCVPEVLALNRHVFAQYTLRHPRRDALAAALAAHDIPSQIYYPRCLHQQPVFSHLPAVNLPESERAAREVLSLPMHPYLEPADQDRVIARILEFAADGED